jgi:GNAT superfamily N-acetyltransferase
MIETIFRPADSEKEIKAAVGFMSESPMHYPRYEDWLARAETQMFAGTKHVMLCRCDSRLVATLTWQTHPNEPFTAELKNMRVLPEFRFMDIGRFLLKAFERDAWASKHALLRCDMGENNVAHPFFIRQGWRQIDFLDLYGSGVRDVMMVKTLAQREYQ